ncbi:MAG: helix-turn-helix transcriptional regulator [Balneolaceae bacterium]|nr:helix-turn-helix transcriptional regulator [Balneolaceae bacterium]
MKKNGVSKRKTEKIFGEASNLQQFINKYETQFKSLAPREVEALTLIAQGFENVVIAEKMAIKSKTLHNYQGSIRRKLGVKNEIDYIKYALAFGLIPF